MFLDQCFLGSVHGETVEDIRYSNLFPLLDHCDWCT